MTVVWMGVRWVRGACRSRAMASSRDYTPGYISIACADTCGGKFTAKLTFFSYVDTGEVSWDLRRLYDPMGGRFPKMGDSTDDAIAQEDLQQVRGCTLLPDYVRKRMGDILATECASFGVPPESVGSPRRSEGIGAAVIWLR